MPNLYTRSLQHLTALLCNLFCLVLPSDSRLQGYRRDQKCIY